MNFSIGICSFPMDPMDSIGTTFYPLIQHEWNLIKSLTNGKWSFPSESIRVQWIRWTHILYWTVFISPTVWNMCENLHYESVYFKELHNEREYYWPTIYRTGAAVVSTITSIGNSMICSDIWHKYQECISKLLCVISPAVMWVKFETILKYHLQITLLFVYTTNHKRFVIL